jgi:hypothetical protein
VGCRRRVGAGLGIATAESCTQQSVHTGGLYLGANGLVAVVKAPGGYHGSAGQPESRSRWLSLSIIAFKFFESVGVTVPD